MPIVKEVTARVPGRLCNAGDGEIKPGDRYYTWSFYRQASMARHVRCGYPRRSTLTQSKLHDVYAAQESAQDAIAALNDPHTVADDIEPIMSDLASAVGEVAESYREAAEAMGAAGEIHETSADALDSYGNDMENWQAENGPDYNGRVVADAEWSKYLESVKDEATQAVDELEM